MDSTKNKKQCSRQLQCEVPCGIGNVVNSSLSSLSSTSHAVQGGGVLATGAVQAGGGRLGRVRGLGVRGQGTFPSTCHVLHYHMVLRPKGTSHNNLLTSTPCCCFTQGGGGVKQTMSKERSNSKFFKMEVALLRREATIWKTVLLHHIFLTKLLCPSRNATVHTHAVWQPRRCAGSPHLAVDKRSMSPQVLTALCSQHTLFWHTGHSLLPTNQREREKSVVGFETNRLVSENGRVGFCCPGESKPIIGLVSMKHLPQQERNPVENEWLVTPAPPQKRPMDDRNDRQTHVWNTTSNHTKPMSFC